MSIELVPRPSDDLPAVPVQDAFAVLVCHDTGHPTVRLTGEVDLTNADTVSEAFRALADVGEQRVDLDFSGVTFMDSTGIRSLLEGIGLGLDLRIVATSPRVARVLEIAGMNAILDTQQSLAG